VKHGHRQIKYLYNLGENWAHTVEIESGFQPDKSVEFPVCLDGRGSCPPEDVGGLEDYCEFLEAINDPDHERHRELLDWCGGWFDPEGFDLEWVNRALSRMR
jgi:hypothetical protein